MEILVTGAAGRIGSRFVADHERGDWRLRRADTRR